MGNKKRGRPAKECPAVSEVAVAEARRLVRQYRDIKDRCVITPKRRNVMFRKLGVSLSGYKATGEIQYQHELLTIIPEYDRKTMELYERDMKKAWILEKGVANIPDERTRAIAEDTLLGGVSCDRILGKYGIGRMTAYREKDRAIRFVAAFMNK